jgi:hypothetical protein
MLLQQGLLLLLLALVPSHPVVFNVGSACVVHMAQQH